MIAVVAAGCNSGERPQATPTPTDTPSSTPAPSPTATTEPTPTPTPTPAASEPATQPTEEATDQRQWSTCEHPQQITVAYPASWHVNSADTLPPCSAFDPQPLDVPEAQEFFDAGALLSVEQVDFGTIADPAAQSGRELHRRATTVDGHDAVRIEVEAQGDQLLPDGTRSTRWLIVMGRDKTLTLTTHETGSADEYEAHRDVLDEMATRLELPANQ